MVTPNSFECEKLTGVVIKDMPSAMSACDALHAMGPTVVVITSMHFEGEDGKLTIMVSDKSQSTKWAVGE
jgi:pyridoxine kinase